MATINKTSIRIPSQLPDFIRDDVDYDTFVAFAEAYYEWTELTNTSNGASTLVSASNQGTTYASHNIQNYSDIDSTLDEFINYYVNDFLPNFPEDTLADKSKVIKLARQLYQSKGTPASYKLLFRLLYNSDAQLLYTKELVFRASSGEWYVPQYLKVTSPDLQWISPNLKNLRLFGQDSKSFAVIENIVSTNKSNKYNIYISQIERLFKSGEYVRVVDSANQNVYFKDGEIVPSGTQGAELLTAHIVGSISTININKKYRGLKYKVGDPVVVYGGVEEVTGIRATAEVAETTSGSIQRLNIINGGHGYRILANSRIVFTGGGGSGAIAHVQTVNAAAEIANVTFVGSDLIALKQHLQLNALTFGFSSNASANILTTIANSLSFLSFSTSPIDSVIVDNGGGGYYDVPIITAESTYKDELPSETLWIKDGTIYPTNVTGSIPISSNTHNLVSIGILAPPEITTKGTGYVVGDKIVFSGGTGVGAFANVTEVNGLGGINKIEYVSNYLNTSKYPLGGMGYTNQNLPKLTVTSTAGVNANVLVSNILGTGAQFNAQTDRIGSITRIGITEAGEDYVSTPSVSFKVQDILVTNIVGDIGSILAETEIKQGVDPSFNFTGHIDSVTIVNSTINPLTDVYKFRVYNYSGGLNYGDTITAYSQLGANTTMQLTNAYDGAVDDASAFHNGIKIYGNGTAKGVAKFLEGLIFGQGRYLTTTGQPSSYSVLQSDIHNDYTYILSVEQPISKYRDLLKGLLHPAGTRVIGRDIMKNEKNFDFHKYSGLGLINPLQYWINWPVGDPSVTVSMNVSSNMVTYSNTVNVSTIAGTTALDSLSNTDFLVIHNDTGPVITSRIKSVDGVNSTITLDDDTFLTYTNVIYGYANTEINKIQISDFCLTNTPNYDIINNRNYSDANNHLKDIVFVGDNVIIGGNTFVVMGVNYDDKLLSIVNFQSLVATDPNGDLVLTNEPTPHNLLIGEYIISAGTKENPVPITINRIINTNKAYIRKSS